MLGNIRIKAKIACVFLVLVAIIALSGFVSFEFSADLARTNERADQLMRLTFATKDALASAIDTNSYLRGFVMAHDAVNKAKIPEAQERFTASIALARTMADVDGPLAGQIDDLVASEAKWRKDMIDLVMPLASSPDTAD